MTNTKLLQGKMKAQSYTVGSLAKALGMSRTGLFNKIHNIREFTVREMLAVSDMLLLSFTDREQIFFSKM